MDRIIRPKFFLSEMATSTPRRIESCSWFRRVNVAFDLPDGNLTNPTFQKFVEELSSSLAIQGHPYPGRPDNSSDMIIGFHEIPNDDRPLEDRIEEVEPALAIRASRQYDIDALGKNYVAVVEVPEKLDDLGKRQQERLTRIMLARLGALKVVIFDPDNIYFATMEGGRAVEARTDPRTIDRLRDRLVIQACSQEAGKYEPKKEVISETDWQASPYPAFLVDAFRQMGQWGYIDKPFEISKVVSPKRLKLIQMIMGYSRQSESAGAVWADDICAPEEFRMGRATGVLVSTGSGRFNINKRDMNPDRDIVAVSIVPRDGVHDPRSLYSFDRFALGRKGRDIIGPSIEFDEMAATFRNSQLIRVSRHSSGRGFIRDSSGNILLPRVRGFIHLHAAVDRVLERNIDGRDGSSLVEYLAPNLKEFPYPTGCGKDITFACSTDAAVRSRGVEDVNSGIAVAFFDSLNHGTNALVLTEESPGSDLIPSNPLELFLRIVEPHSGVAVMTEEIAQV